jgi:hypothetical protein
MRIGKRLGVVAVVAMSAAMTAHLAAGAEAAKRVQPVPIGIALENQTGDQHFGVYVPTAFGGQLTVSTSAGELGPIIGPDGREHANGEDLGTNNTHGWYTFTVSKATGPYSVSANFVQVGQSARKPWNFYYWPTKSDAIHEPWAGGNGRVDTMRTMGDDVMVARPGAYIPPGEDIVRAGPNGVLETPVAPGDTSTWFPNQYDDLTWTGPDGTIYQTPSPMLKYDQLFRSQARNWEAANNQNQDISRWQGHCLGGAVASILLNEPNPAPGSGLTKDELKALWAELGENHLNHQIGDFATDMAAGPPRPGPDDCDRFVPRFHTMLETHIRGQKQALLGNLRAFPPRGTVSEVWNHGIGKYTARFTSIPGKGERAVKLEVELEANSGSCLNGQDDKPRIITYTYILVYSLEGRVDESQAYSCDWIGLRGEALFAPLNILEVTGTRWVGHNPYVTESNVRAIDLNNGGTYGRFAGAPPEFRPVNVYEAGRRPLFAGRLGLGNGSTRRVGLFRFFGGGGDAAP